MAPTWPASLWTDWPTCRRSWSARSAPADVPIDVELLDPFDVQGMAVLVHTGLGRASGAPRGYADGAPFLTERACQWLVEQGAALVGIDSVNIDDTADPTRPAHSLLLAAGIPMVEHLTGLGRAAGARRTVHRGAGSASPGSAPSRSERSLWSRPSPRRTQILLGADPSKVEVDR